jgi:cytochrome b561
MEEMGLSPTKIALIGWHKSFGITVLIITLLRFGWRVINIIPPLPGAMTPWQRLLAHLSHLGLYALLLLMPLTGWLMSSAKGIPVSVFGWFILPQLITPDKILGEFLEELHELFAWGLLGLIALHTSAALLHHFYYKDTVLMRMLPAWRQREKP